MLSVHRSERPSGALGALPQWAAPHATISFDEFLFVYDVAAGTPRRTQVLKVPNTFMGLAWNPRGHEFYVAGGVNDNG